MSLQEVCDSNCYFTSFNTSVSSSVYDSYHLKCNELYHKVEQFVMFGLNKDPYALLAIPVYIVADHGYQCSSVWLHITNRELWERL